MARGPLSALLVAPHFLAPGPLRVMTSHIETLVQQLDGKADECRRTVFAPQLCTDERPQRLGRFLRII
ncbi:hypothetical protein SSIG_04887 [Streptomyces filamentosus NRRL 11379]|uniref:AviX5 n=1 Tax=Streptomyces filamentosus NRRL 15998 TaxID=457431 RepID=D6AJN1_STRFL|nr:AviX5 [Streptomyces filamentosus NRRL 15998]EWS94251.1 hypothetical protein SSIG_04887 [Streptomyces filamentosus NRRL 11379]